MLILENKNNIRRVFLIKSEEITNFKWFDYRPEIIKKGFFPWSKSKVISKAFEAGFYHEQCPESHIDKHTQIKYLIKEKKVFSKPRVYIEKEEQTYDQSFYFDTNQEAHEWLTNFLEKNNLTETLIKIEK